MECGDEMPKAYIKEFGLICPVCLREIADLIRKGEDAYERKDSYI
jgi:ribosomal protein S14